MWLLRKFWFQLLLAVVLGWITGMIWSHYRRADISTPIPTGGITPDSHIYGDCGAWSDEEECGS